MGESCVERSGDGDSPDELNSALAFVLEPGEALLWTGRPEPWFVARRLIPKAIGGVALALVILFWMAGVARGGNNNWDHGKAVAPFARNNIMIAALMGSWFLPPALYMITSPLRPWWKARRTIYAVTDRRALVMEPRLTGGNLLYAYPPEALVLMQCDEHDGGAGDLIFEHRKTWLGGREAVGFLAIEQVCEAEAQLRTILVSGEINPLRER